MYGALVSPALMVTWALLLRVTTRSWASGWLTCTVNVGLTFSATEVWSAVMVTLTKSPSLPGVPGSSVTVVLTGVLSSVSCSNLPTSAPSTVAIDITTGSLVPT
ncbi:hypothetical protein D3C80_1934410 [compost metagenome]